MPLDLNYICILEDALNTHTYKYESHPKQIFFFVLNLYVLNIVRAYGVAVVIAMHSSQSFVQPKSETYSGK